MEFDNAFEVPLPPAQAWPVLMNIQGIAPCMPGAQLTEVVDDKSYKGNIAVRPGRRHDPGDRDRTDEPVRQQSEEAARRSSRSGDRCCGHGRQTDFRYLP